MVSLTPKENNNFHNLGIEIQIFIGHFITVVTGKSIITFVLFVNEEFKPLSSGVAEKNGINLGIVLLFNLPDNNH